MRDSPQPLVHLEAAVVQMATLEPGERAGASCSSALEALEQRLGGAPGERSRRAARALRAGGARGRRRAALRRRPAIRQLRAARPGGPVRAERPAVSLPCSPVTHRSPAPQRDPLPAMRRHARAPRRPPRASESGARGHRADVDGTRHRRPGRR